MKTAERIIALALVTALALWVVFAASSARTCGESDAAVERLLHWELRAALDGQTVRVTAAEEAAGPAEAPFSLRAFESSGGRPGLAVFSHSGGKMKLEHTVLWPYTEQVLGAYAVSLYSPDRQEQKEYNIFLVLDARVASMEETRYYGPGASPTPLPGAVQSGLRAPCIVAFPAPEPSAAWHVGGYVCRDASGAVVTELGG